MKLIVLTEETRLPGMSTYLLTLKDAWRAVDALGGSYSLEQKANGFGLQQADAIERACSLIADEIYKVQGDEMAAGFFEVPEAAG